MNGRKVTVALLWQFQEDQETSYRLPSRSWSPQFSHFWEGQPATIRREERLTGGAAAAIGPLEKGKGNIYVRLIGSVTEKFRLQ